ncbi:hypothetical protein Cfor_01181 [Coptotermes formosanus]|uniref:Uncharacterized protein n=1 Tax=Coptotermes formosanus TaxID=36987 RepID=A0A6L2PPX2_COPFO|nr:hypothetical protein Cfor_01181 [Coptotermes formosanus]
MVKEFKNVTMTCSKSGKLTTKLYASFWKDGLHPYSQITNFMKHQYCAHMLCEEEEISSHEDATKLHLLLHHQVHESAFEHVIICMVCFKTDK